MAYLLLHVSVFVTIFQKCARPKVRPYLDTEKRALQLLCGVFPNWAIIYPYFVALKFREVLKWREKLQLFATKKFFTLKVIFLGNCFHKRQAKSPQHASPSKTRHFDHYLHMNSLI